MTNETSPQTPTLADIVAPMLRNELPIDSLQDKNKVAQIRFQFERSYHNAQCYLMLHNSEFYENPVAIIEKMTHNIKPHEKIHFSEVGLLIISDDRSLQTLNELSPEDPTDYRGLLLLRTLEDHIQLQMARISSAHFNHNEEREDTINRAEEKLYELLSFRKTLLEFYK